jgi:hypothetical protein
MNDASCRNPHKQNTNRIQTEQEAQRNVVTCRWQSRLLAGSNLDFPYYKAVDFDPLHSFVQNIIHG